MTITGAAAIKGVIALIRRLSIVVKPLRTLNLSPDESDNRFFECADTAHAHYIVTGNKKDFPLVWKIRKSSSRAS
ncbi:MAG: hypothetical protein WA324_15795 [Bryobacteraceae bacterium]